MGCEQSLWSRSYSHHYHPCQIRLCCSCLFYRVLFIVQSEFELQVVCLEELEVVTNRNGILCVSAVAPVLWEDGATCSPSGLDKGVRDCRNDATPGGGTQGNCVYCPRISVEQCFKQCVRLSAVEPCIRCNLGDSCNQSDCVPASSMKPYRHSTGY